MTLYLLIRTHSRAEFATAAAINAMLHRPDPDGDLRPIGAVALVPREVIGNQYETPAFNSSAPLIGDTACCCVECAAVFD